jgi:uncharacterized protein
VRAMDRIVWYRRRWVATSLFGLAFAVPFFVTLAAMENDRIVQSAKTHRIVFQINSDDPIAMKHAITNSLNAMKNYGEKGEVAAIEIVAYGHGVHMFRADTSPVKDLLQFLRANHPDVRFSVCGNTRMIVEQKEGHSLALVDGAQVVPFGVVRLVELQEAGWTYLRP